MQLFFNNAQMGPKTAGVSNGMEIPFFEEGPLGPQILNAKDMNVLVAVARAIVNARVVQDEEWGIDLSDSGLVLRVGNPPVSGANGVGGSQSAFRIKSVQGDYVTARLWDGSSDGATDIALAKEYSLRNSLAGESIYGVTHTYSYAAGPDSNNVYRTNSDGTNSQAEVVTPPWRVNEIVYASPCNTLLVDGGGAAITWLMTRTGVWAKPSPLAVAPTTPSSATDTTNGYSAGLIVADGSYLYVSTGANTWKRVAIATW
jgi:hypothetical protein